MSCCMPDGSVIWIPIGVAAGDFGWDFYDGWVLENSFTGFQRDPVENYRAEPFDPIMPIKSMELIEVAFDHELAA